MTVGYATEDGTADAGSDYTAGSGTLTFESGAREQTIAVAVIDDSEEEGSETFTVRLSDARNATLLDGEGTATIRDDEYSGVRVSYGAESYTVKEGEFVAVEVVLSASPDRPLTIPLTHVPGNGAGRQDYSGVPESVRFDSFETTKTFNVTAEEDDEHDDGESIILGFGTLPPGVRAGCSRAFHGNHCRRPAAERPSTDGLAQGVRRHGGGSCSGCTRRADAVRAVPPVGGSGSGPRGSPLAVHALPGAVVLCRQRSPAGRFAGHGGYLRISPGG